MNAYIKLLIPPPKRLGPASPQISVLREIRLILFMIVTLLRKIGDSPRDKSGGFAGVLVPAVVAYVNLTT